MKKLIIIALALTLSIGLISGCASEPEDKVFSRAGLTITLTDRFTDVTGTEGTEQFTVSYGSEADRVGILALKEEFSIFEAAGISTDISLSEYAQMVIDGNGQNCRVEQNDGLTYFTYDNNGFTYYSVVYRGSDAFWLIQFFASVEDYGNMTSNIRRWAQTVDVGTSEINNDVTNAINDALTGQQTASPPSVTSLLINNTTWTGSYSIEGMDAGVEITFSDDNIYYFLIYVEGIDYYYVNEGTYNINSTNENEIILSSLRAVEYDGSDFTDTEDSGTDTLVIDGDIITMDAGDTVLTLEKGRRSGIWWYGRDISSSAGITAADLSRTVTLGQFQIHNVDGPETQMGWCNDIFATNYDLNGSFIINDFTSAEYLVLVLGEPPKGGIDFVWQGDDFGWNQTTQFVPAGGTDETTIIFKLSDMEGYSNFLKVEHEMIVYVCYYSDSWNDLPLSDAYLAISK